MNDSVAHRPSRALMWSLAATLVATGWALWWPGAVPAVVDAGTREGAPASRQAAALKLMLSVPTAVTHIEAAARLSDASRDPFFPEPVAPPTPPRTSAAESEDSAPSPVAPPAPPPLTYRLMGRMLSPNGTWLIFLQDGAQIVQASAGVALPNGYVVEAVTDKEVRLRHSLAEQAVSLPIPQDNAP